MMHTLPSTMFVALGFLSMTVGFINIATPAVSTIGFVVSAVMMFAAYILRIVEGDG